MNLAASGGQLSISTVRPVPGLACLLLAVFLSVSCSVPNLEKPQCTEARLAARRFYSFHFGNDMMTTTENLKAREHFLTPELLRSLTAAGDSRFDHFTSTESYPKAFRIGSCTAEASGRADLQVVLLWRDDNGSDQKEVHAEFIKSGNDWLINNVSK